MPSHNYSCIIGHLTRDVEVRHTPGGTAVADVSVAVNKTYKDKQSGNKIEEVSFVDCTLWGRTAEVAAEYAKKGDAILVEGELKQDTWQDKDSGQNRSKLKINARGITLLGSKGGGNSGGNSGGGYQRQQNQQSSQQKDPAESFYDNSGPDDEVPF